MTSVLWLPEAVADTVRLIEFLHVKSPAAARRAALAFRDGDRLLKKMPLAGKSLGDDTGRRELIIPFSAGAYVLRYRIQNEHCAIIRVWHSRELRE